jgi:hypothetical protein
MGSVVTYWSGTSKDASIQAELFSFIAKLATASDERLRRRGISCSTTRESTSEPPPSRVEASPSNVVQFDQSISGRVLVGNSLILFDQLNPSMQQSARKIASSESWRPETTSVSLVVSSKADDQRYVIPIPAFQLRGIAFRLYDPRDLYPDEDWMSFAFVEAPELPELDGQIVHARSLRTCRVQSGEWLQNAEWSIDTPSIHLRYYLEEWFDLLMTWIKIFSIDNLDYWRDTVLNRFEELKHSVDRLIESDGHEVAKQAIFEYIVECFEEEADQLESEIANAS